MSQLPLCVKGKWMTAEGAMRQLEIDTVQRLKKCAKIAPHVHRESGRRVEATAPYKEHFFYYVASPEQKATQVMTITLLEWVRLCRAIGRCKKHVTASLTDDEIELLKKYSSRQYEKPPTKAMLNELMDSLIVVDAIVLPWDLRALTETTTMAAADATESNEPTSTPPPAQQEHHETSMLPCHGLGSDIVDEYARLNPRYCLQNWEFFRGQWRSKGCTLVAAERRSGHTAQRCGPCYNAYKNLKDSRYPDLFAFGADTISDLVVEHLPCVDVIRSELSKWYGSLNDSTLFTSDDRVQWWAHIWKLVLASPTSQQTNCIQLETESSKMVYVALCSCVDKNAACLGLHVLERAPTSYDTLVCRECQNDSKLQKRRETRRESNIEQQTRVGSFANWTKLTPERQKMRYDNTMKELRLTRYRLARANEKLALSEQDGETELGDGERRKTLGRAFTYILENGEDLVAQLAAAVAGQMGDGGVAPEHCRFAEGIVETFRNYRKVVVDGKVSQARFSPQLLRLALSVWLTSPAAYEELQSSGFMVMPSIKTLQRLKKEQSITDGVCLKIYEMDADRRGGVEEHGHVMCDEMKIKTGIYWNTHTHQIVGFADDLDDFSTAISALLDTADSEDETEGPGHAKSVNQWKFRSVLGRSFNCEFFFNNGTLNGKTLVNQLLHVVRALETVGCHVHGFQCDAGGNNARLFKYLRDNRIPGTQVWFDGDLVAFSNPKFPEQKIWIWHCATHLLKAMRNNLFASRDGGSQAFCDAQGTPFGWQGIQAALARDGQLASPKTSLEAKAVYLEGWSVMNVSYAKAVFDHKTLGTMLNHVASENGVNLTGYDPTNCAWTMPTTDNNRRYHGIILGKLNYIRWQIELNHVNVSPQSISDMALLEYAGNIHDLFIALFLNSEESITLGNLPRMKSFITKRLDAARVSEQNFCDQMGTLLEAIYITNRGGLGSASKALLSCKTVSPSTMTFGHDKTWVIT